MVPPAPYLQCKPHLTPDGSGVLSDPAWIDEEFRKAWLPYFCPSGQREASLEEVAEEVDGWLPLLPVISLPHLTGEMLAGVVRRKGATAGSLDGWGWRELKVLPVAWYDGLVRILSKVEDTGVWPDGLLDAYIAMIPETDGDATTLGQRLLSVLPIVYRIWASARMGQLDGWFQSWVPQSVFSAGGGRSSVEAWYTFALDEYHAHVRFRFNLAAGLGVPLNRDCGISQGMPWCRYLAAQEEVQPQLYADNLKCLSEDPGVLWRAPRFTTGCVRLVGQELAPGKCVLLYFQGSPEGYEGLGLV